MIVLSSNPNIGDAVTSIPAIQKLLETYTDDFYFGSNCPQFDQLFTHPRLRPLYEAPIGETEAIVLAIREIVDKHPTMVQLDQAGFVVDPDATPSGFLTADQRLNVPMYDFLIAPHTRDMGLRGWTWEGWRDLVTLLYRAYPNCLIGMIGSHDDRMQMLRDDQVNDAYVDVMISTQSEYGRDLREVMALMARTRKAVITVDSAPSRIAHGLGISNHVLLCADCVPFKWGSWPGARGIHGKIKEFTAEQVLGLIRSLP